MIDYLDTLALIYVTTFVIIISPGPSSLTIISTAMMQGRKPAFGVAGGVITGALTWGTSAAIGVSALLAAFPNGVTAIQLFGGCYLSYLAYCSGIRVLTTPEIKPPDLDWKKRYFYLKGYTVHMSNPEAMLGWIAIMSMGLTDDAPEFAPVYIVSGCISIALVVYNCYAYFFSVEKIASFYLSVRRVVDTLFAAFFAFAAFKLFEVAL